MSEKKVNRRPSWEKGYRKEIMTFLLSIGVLTYPGMTMLGEGENQMYRRKINEMKGEGYVVVRKPKTGKMVTIKNFEENCDAYIPYYKNGYYRHYNRYAKPLEREAAEQSSKPERIERTKRYSELAALLRKAEIGILFEEKPVLNREGTEIPQTGSFFYSTREIKDVGNFITGVKADEAGEKMVINSRCLGWVTSEGGDYMMYHTGKKQMRWNKTGEQLMAACIKSVRNKKKCLKKTEITEAVLVATDVQIYVKMVQTENSPVNLLSVNNGMPVMYAIPYSQFGRKLLHCMLQESWKEKMKMRFLKGADLNTKTSVVSCDGIIDDVKILLFCIPDIVKMKKFLGAARIEGVPSHYRIYCFDEQKEMVMNIAEGNCEIYETSFSEFYEEFSEMVSQP